MRTLIAGLLILAATAAVAATPLTDAQIRRSSMKVLPRIWPPGTHARAPTMSPELAQAAEVGAHIAGPAGPPRSAIRAMAATEWSLIGGERVTEAADVISPVTAHSIALQR